MNRLDEEEFDQPCMNPEAPDPPASTSGGPSGRVAKGNLGNGKVDPFLGDGGFFLGNYFNLYDFCG